MTEISVMIRFECFNVNDRLSNKFEGGLLIENIMAPFWSDVMCHPHPDR